METDRLSYWRHAVLEIYSLDDNFPDVGEPAAWIKNRQVMWCDGREEDLVQHIPLWRIIWWKLKHTGYNIKDYGAYLLGFVNGENRRLDKWFEELQSRDDDHHSSGSEREPEQQEE